MPRSTSSRRCASGSGRSSSGSRRGAMPATALRASSGSSGSTRRSPSGHWVPEQIRRAGGWDLLGADGEKAHPDHVGRRRRGRPRDAVPHAVRLSTSRRRSATGRGRPIPPWLSRPAGGPSRARSSRVDGSAYFSRPGPRVIDGIELLAEIMDPDGFRRHRPAGRLDAGPGRLTVPFRASFSCLWCGTAHTVRSPDDLEGWAQLCPDCVGKAGDNGFLRFRLRQALTERSAAARGVERRDGATDRARRWRRAAASEPSPTRDAGRAPTPDRPPTPSAR